MESWTSLLGTITIAIILLRILYYIWRLAYVYYIGYYLGLSCDFGKYGPWCIVTGCTDGIGKAYAHAFAKLGLKIVMISRNASKLEATSAEIREKYGVDTKIVAVDFTSEKPIYDEISEQIRGLEIGILVNNVGISQWPGFLCDIPDREKCMRDVVAVNVMPCAMMTSLVIQQMNDRKKGLIINVSSLSSATPMPGFSIYGASKCFVNYFSAALAAEYKDRGIIVQTVIPGYVSTKMSTVKPSLTAPTPDEFVRRHLRTVGLSEESCGFILHALMQLAGDIMQHLPTSVRQSLILSSLKPLLAKYKKKLAATQKST